MAQTESRRQFPRSFAQKNALKPHKEGPYEQNADGQDTGKPTPEYLRFVRPEDYHDDLPDGHNPDGELDYDHDGDYEIPDTLKDQIKNQNIIDGYEWGYHSEHGKPTYPFKNDDGTADDVSKELNFPGSVSNVTEPSSLDAKV